MKRLYFFIFSLWLSSTNVFAASANQFDYVGLAIQYNSYDNINFTPTIDTETLSPLLYKDSTGNVGYRAFVGYQFNRYFAIEGGVTSYGDADFKVKEENQSNGVTTYKTLHKGSFSTLAGDIRLVGTYPISEKVFLKASVGAVAWDTDHQTLIQDNNNLSVEKESDSGMTALMSAGIGYGFNRSSAVTFEVEKTEIKSINTHNISLSFMFRF